MVVIVNNKISPKRVWTYYGQNYTKSTTKGEKMISKLKSLIDKNGHVFVAYHLGQRDTWSIKQWIKRKQVPATWKERVKLFLKEGK